MKFRLILLTIAFLLTFNAFSQVRKREDIQKNPLDISEYFLLIPSEENWALEGDEFDPFIGRQQYFDPDPKYKVTIDKKNAYIKILYETNGLESCFTMCYFIKADKTKLIAAHYYQEGGDCDSYLLKFYTYSPATKKCTDVTKQVLPMLTLKDLKSTQQIPVEFIYTLPQYGTSIAVHANAICEQRSYEEKINDYMDYYSKYQKLPFKDISLKWNKEMGVFEKGEVK